MVDKDKIISFLRMEFPNAIITLIKNYNYDTIRIDENTTKKLVYIDIRVYITSIILNDYLYEKECFGLEYIKKYITTYYDYKILNYYNIKKLPNFNNEKYNQVINNYIDKTLDYSIFKNENLFNRLDSNMLNKWDYIINANKFDLL